MKRIFIALATIILVFPHVGQSQNLIIPVPFNQVTLTDGFWKDRMQTEIAVTVPFSVAQSEPAIERFRRCAAFLAGEKTELPQTHRFISSDLYKVMEGVAYSLMIQKDPELEKKMDMIIDLIAGSQQADGYIYISHTCGNPDPREMGDKPYSWVVHSHELYNVGHMYEAAVAYYQATGKDKLLNVSIKNAKHVNRVFFEGDPNYNNGKPINQAPGHQEIELALCKLYRVTDDRLYLEMAKKFLDIRGVTYRPDGDVTMSASYAQQHAPVTKQTEAVGHAVRAAYLYTAMAQVDALTGRSDYSSALNTIWGDLVSTRMHITGGLGAVEGVEGFGAQYDLPNLTAYNETCAAVANVFFNHGMYLASGDAKFLDVAELSLYNNALAGINISGDRFFYVNPLETNGVRRFNHGHGGRAEWFGCACCPPNISRLILQVPGYMYSYGENKIYLTMYGSSRTSIQVANTNVDIDQQSAYPFDGKVKVRLDPTKKRKFELYMRIPTWADSEEFVPGGLYPFKNSVKSKVSISVNGKKVQYRKDKGFAVVEREWSKDDLVEMNIPMPVRFVESDPKVKMNIGTTAVTRGPLVYCAEEMDNDGVVQRLSLEGANEKDAKVAKFNDGALSGIDNVTLNGMEKLGNDAASCDITMIPYYAWNNRGDNKTMIVWLKDKVSSYEDAAQMNYIKNIKGISSSSRRNDASTEAVCDAKIALASNDFKSAPAWVSTAVDGEKSEWVEVQLHKPVSVMSLSVYWVADEVAQKICLPASWDVEYYTDGQWRKLDLYITDSYQLGKDRFNVVHPEKEIKCSAFRINMRSRSGCGVGISEIRVE